MSSSTIDEALVPTSPAPAAPAVGAASTAISRPWAGTLLASVAWIAAAGVTAFWPDATDDWERTGDMAIAFAVLGIALAAVALAGRRFAPVAARVRALVPWLIALAVLLTIWQVLTAKLALLPRPFFGPPQALLDVYFDDWPRLRDSAFHSVALLAFGYVLGAAVGFVTGVSIGWSRTVGYWVHPMLRLIGPLPATAWLPLAFFFFPSSWSASVFLIALATGFPVTVLTWSGVAGVNSAYYDIARTLGASQRFLVLKVAIPAALPNVFVGLFMGLGASFSVLIVAEMLGVKSGLGWYLQWAQGWAAYANMYGALLLMALIFSGLITLLFRVRDRLLVWQKGVVRW
jgi:NitT/TauT family transport system permease protein